MRQNILINSNDTEEGLSFQTIFSAIIRKIIPNNFSNTEEVLSLKIELKIERDADAKDAKEFFEKFQALLGFSEKFK